MGIATPVETELPRLGPPDDADDFAHIRHGVGLCGNGKGRHEKHKWQIYCERCSCGAPVCPTCKAMLNVVERTGITP